MVQTVRKTMSMLRKAGTRSEPLVEVVRHRPHELVQDQPVHQPDERRGDDHRHDQHRDHPAMGPDQRGEVDGQEQADRAFDKCGDRPEPQREPDRLPEGAIRKHSAEIGEPGEFRRADGLKADLGEAVDDAEDGREAEDRQKKDDERGRERRILGAGAWSHVALPPARHGRQQRRRPPVCVTSADLPCRSGPLPSPRPASGCRPSSR